MFYRKSSNTASLRFHPSGALNEPRIKYVSLSPSLRSSWEVRSTSSLRLHLFPSVWACEYSNGCGSRSHLSKDSYLLSHTRSLSLTGPLSSSLLNWCHMQRDREPTTPSEIHTRALSNSLRHTDTQLHKVFRRSPNLSHSHTQSNTQAHT